MHVGKPISIQVPGNELDFLLNDHFSLSIQQQLTFAPRLVDLWSVSLSAQCQLMGLIGYI